MLYQLESATVDNLDLLIKYKLSSILKHAKDLSEEEFTKINNYVNSSIPKQINDYKVVKLDNKIIGCILVLKHLDGVILDEIFIEEEYRNRKIGTSIIKDILENNNIVYLWVYKSNINAFRLYEKLGFNVISDTENRYFMQYSKLKSAKNICKDV